MQKVAIFYVVTGKYLVFWPDFLATAEQNLLPGCEVHYFVFTDAKTLPGEDGVCPALSEIWGFRANFWAACGIFCLARQSA